MLDRLTTALAWLAAALFTLAGAMLTYEVVARLLDLGALGLLSLSALSDGAAAERWALYQHAWQLALQSQSGSAKLLPAWLGYQRAARMLLAGEPLLAPEALQAGLVAKMVSPAELADTAAAYARTLAAKPPRAMRESKRLMRQAAQMDLHDLIDHDLALFAELLQGDEAKAILAAKVGKK